MRLACATSGASVEIGGALARAHSAVIRGMWDDEEEDVHFPFKCSTPIDSEVLQLIKSYCESHQPHGPPFSMDLSDTRLVQLLDAANALDIEGLLDLGCKELARILDECTVEEIRTRFQLPNDMPVDEVRALDAEDEWLTEKPNAEPAGRLSHAGREIDAATEEIFAQLIEGLPEPPGRTLTESTQAAINRVLESSVVAEGAIREGRASTRACALMVVRMRRTARGFGCAQDRNWTSRARRKRK